MLSFTLSGKHNLITYTDAHAFRLNHGKLITETDIKIIMNSYNPIYNRSDHIQSNLDIYNGKASNSSLLHNS